MLVIKNGKDSANGFRFERFAHLRTSWELAKFWRFEPMGRKSNQLFHIFDATLLMSLYCCLFRQGLNCTLCKMCRLNKNLQKRGRVLSEFLFPPQICLDLQGTKWNKHVLEFRQIMMMIGDNGRSISRNPCLPYIAGDSSQIWLVYYGLNITMSKRSLRTGSVHVRVKLSLVQFAA